MHFQYILQQIGKTLFRFSFYIGATAFAFATVFGNPGVIKRALISTNAYNKFVPAVIAENNKNAQSTNSVSLKDPVVQGIIKDSFPARSLEFNMERVIDGSYNWLNGRTPKPDFKVDFTPNITYMADKLSAYATTRMELLPVCTTHPTTVNPFIDTCRPEFYDFKQSQATLAVDIKANNGLLPKMVLTAADLPKNAEGKTIVEQYYYAPKVFVAAKYAAWVFLAIALQSALLVMYTARKKREAIKYISVTIISSSVFLALTPIFYTYILPRYFSNFAFKAAGGGAASVIEAVTAKLGADFNNVLIQLGVLFALFGLSILVLEKGSRPRSKYLKVPAKAGLESSEPKKVRRQRGTNGLVAVPIQTSEGERYTGKYQKDKKYRKIPRKEL